jgi:hypothetical protein
MPERRPIICTLSDADALQHRVEEWRALLVAAVGRDEIDGGVRVRFRGDPATAAEVARLSAAEQACCSFFQFDLHITAQELALDVRAPDEARELVTSLFG